MCRQKKIYINTLQLNAMKTNTAGKWDRKCWGHATLSKVILEGLSEEVTFQYGTQKHVTINHLLLQVSGIQQPSYPSCWGLLDGFIRVPLAARPHTRLLARDTVNNGTCRSYREAFRWP